MRFDSGRPAETIHSEASVAVTGYAPQELKASPTLWLSIAHPEDLEAVREQVSGCISGQQVKPLEHRIVRKDGCIRWVRRTLVPHFDSQGRLLSYDGLLQDITELKLAEQVQMQLLAEVEQTTEELKDFAYIASHDLKAPLRGISTLAGWISADYGDKLGDEGRAQIGLLLARVKRMHSLIDGVLQYSRLSRTKEKSVKVDLNEVVSEVVAELAPPENVEIVVGKTLPVVTCGRNSIRQVFYSLLNNAVTFMDKPEGRVEINWAEERGFWKFSVYDNGRGIEEKHVERIFKIFQTLLPADGIESAGVGLTITKRVVELYGGEIWVRSKPGQGSTFFFTLPKEPKRLKTRGAAGENCNPAEMIGAGDQVWPAAAH